MTKTPISPITWMLWDDTNNCWAIKYKFKDLIDNGTIAIAPPAAEKHRYQLLPSHATRLLGSSINVPSTEEVPIDRSSLIAPARTIVRVHITKKMVSFGCSRQLFPG